MGEGGRPVLLHPRRKERGTKNELEAHFSSSNVCGGRGGGNVRKETKQYFVSNGSE